MELCTSRLVKLIIQDPSIDKGGLEWISFLGLINLISKVYSAFLWVCLRSVSQFLLKVINRLFYF